jgi:hypothetical protein
VVCGYSCSTKAKRAAEVFKRLDVEANGYLTYEQVRAAPRTS